MVGAAGVDLVSGMLAETVGGERSGGARSVVEGRRTTVHRWEGEHHPFDPDLVATNRPPNGIRFSVGRHGTILILFQWV